MNIRWLLLFFFAASELKRGSVVGICYPPGFQPETRAAIPWQTMLFNYAVLCVPAFFSFLVGLNVLVWSRSRINYVFIFGERVRCWVRRVDF